MTTPEPIFYVGQDFKFQGLPGEPDDGETRLVHIMSVSATGRLCFRIDSPDSRGEHLHDISYLEALTLVEHGIWMEWDGPALKMEY